MAKLSGCVGDLTNPSPVLEIAIGTIGLVIVMIFHGTSVRLINRHYSAVWVKVDAATPHWHVNLLLVLVVTAFTVVHLVGTLIWAVPIHRLPIIPNLRDSYYYVLESYTTLGEGAVSLPEPWRLIGPIIAMSGLFTFGWTGSVLVGIMTEFGELEPQPRPTRPETTTGAEPEA